MSKPIVTIDLRGPDGNVYAVVSRVSAALRRARQPEESKAFERAAFHGCSSYDEVLAKAREYVDLRTT